MISKRRMNMSEIQNNLHNPEWVTKKTQLSVNLGLGFNILLAFLKTIVGVIGHSAGLLADGINSTSDVVYYLAVKFFLKWADQPADEEHPFGHRQMESIASIVISAFVITTAIAIFSNSVNNIYDYWVNPAHTDAISIVSLYIALFTLLVKIFLSLYTRMMGDKLKNPAIKALAADHINDIFAASGVIIGIICAKAGWVWLDPMAGCVVSLFILKTGIEILKDGSSSLMDVCPSDEIVDDVIKKVEMIEEIKDIESIYSHRFGPYYTLNITIALDGKLTMDEGDCIADRLEEMLCKDNFFLKQVFIHYHPLKQDKNKLI